MAAKGQLCNPKTSLKRAFDHAMELIDGCEDRVAIFMVGGEVMGTKSTSASFENNVNRLASGLVGVYNLGVDARQVIEDLAAFYPFSGINIDRAHKGK